MAESRTCVSEKRTDQLASFTGAVPGRVDRLPLAHFMVCATGNEILSVLTDAYPGYRLAMGALEVLQDLPRGENYKLDLPKRVTNCKVLVVWKHRQGSHVACNRTETFKP